MWILAENETRLNLETLFLHDLHPLQVTMRKGRREEQTFVDVDNENVVNRFGYQATIISMVLNEISSMESIESLRAKNMHIRARNNEHLTFIKDEDAFPVRFE